MAHKDVPAFRVAAQANISLNDYLADEPLVLSETSGVDWDVSSTDYHYIAKGYVQVPVELWFSTAEDDESELELRRLIVAGKREYDARLEEVQAAGEAAAPSGSTLNEAAVRAESLSRYLKRIGGK